MPQQALDFGRSRHHHCPGIAAMAAAGAVVQRGIDNASVERGSPKTNAVRSQCVKAYWQVLAMPFDRAERQVDDRALGEKISDFVWAQQFELARGEAKRGHR